MLYRTTHFHVFFVCGFTLATKYSWCLSAGSNWSYLLDHWLYSDHEWGQYTAQCHQYWEASQLQVVVGDLAQHTSVQVGPGREMCCKSFVQSCYFEMLCEELLQGFFCSQDRLIVIVPQRSLSSLHTWFLLCLTSHTSLLESLSILGRFLLKTKFNLNSFGWLPIDNLQT